MIEKDLLVAYCTRCGTDAADMRFCPQCGAAITAGIKTPTPEVELTATLDSVPTETISAVPIAPAPLPSLPPAPTAVPTIAPPKRLRAWNGPRITAAAATLITVAAAGFLLAYFLVPTSKGDARAAVIPPPLPQAALSAAQEADQAAPDVDTTEGAAYAELAHIAARDKPTLQSTQLWRTQVASGKTTDSAVDFLQRYRDYLTHQPDLLLAWSGDWPHTWGTSSQNNWVLLSSDTSATTAPILRACKAMPAAERCWAIRLSTIGSPTDNEDHGTPDPSKN